MEEVEGLANLESVRAEEGPGAEEEEGAANLESVDKETEGDKVDEEDELDKELSRLALSPFGFGKVSVSLIGKL
jgi:hypothetical protein